MKFFNHINNFRGIAILFIILGHSIQPFNSDLSEGTLNLLRVLFQYGTIFFVFVAGYLFQHLSYKFEYKKYLVSKIKNVLVPYLLMSIPIFFYWFYISERQFDHSIPREIFYMYVTGGHLLPFWFIPMICLFYVTAPIFIKLDKTKCFYYFLPLFFLMSTLVPRNNLSAIQSFVHFFSVYSFGMFCSRKKDSVIIFLDKNRFMLIIIYLVLIAVALLTRQNFLSYSLTLQFWSKIFLAAILVLLLYKYNNFFNKKFDYLAQISFGLFFVHYYYIFFLGIWLNKVVDLGLYNNLINLIMYILFSIVVICTSSLTIEIVKKVTKKYSKFIIGS